MEPIPASEAANLPKLLLQGTPPGFTPAFDDLMTAPEGESTMFGRVVTRARSWEAGETYVTNYVSLYWNEKLARAAHRAKSLKVCKGALSSFKVDIPAGIGTRVELGEETLDQVAFQKGRYIFAVGIGSTEAPPAHHKDVIYLAKAAFKFASRKFGSREARAGRIPDVAGE
jgi:hypothetical protein